MKIAVCVSGHLTQKPNRVSVEEFINSFNSIFGKKYSDLDFFLAVTYNNENDYLYNLLIDHLKPKKIVEFSKIDPPVIPNFVFKREETNIFNTIHMFWKIWLCNEAKKQYELTTGTKYSLVIRTRPDLYFSKSLPLIDLIKLRTGIEKIWLPYFPWDINKYAVSDFFAIGKSKFMDYYSEVYLNLELIYKKGIIFHPETLLGYHLKSKYKLNPANTLCYLDINVTNSNGYSSDLYI
jgi:hypothetical protein